MDPDVPGTQAHSDGDLLPFPDVALLSGHLLQVPFPIFDLYWPCPQLSQRDADTDSLYVPGVQGRALRPDSSYPANPKQSASMLDLLPGVVVPVGHAWQ